MLNDSTWIFLLGALLAGAGLGVMFFAGLWWTIRRGAASATPARWFISSLLLRTGIVLAGFYGVGAGQPLRLGMCLLGFVLARALVLRMTRNPAALSTYGEPPCA